MNWHDLFFTAMLVIFIIFRAWVDNKRIEDFILHCSKSVQDMRHLNSHMNTRNSDYYGYIVDLKDEVDTLKKKVKELEENK